MSDETPTGSGESEWRNFVSQGAGFFSALAGVDSSALADSLSGLALAAGVEKAGELLEDANWGEKLLANTDMPADLRAALVKALPTTPGLRFLMSFVLKALYIATYMKAVTGAFALQPEYEANAKYPQRILTPQEYLPLAFLKPENEAEFVEICRKHGYDMEQFGQLLVAGMHRYEPAEIARLFSSGTVTPEKAIQRLMQIGYSENKATDILPHIAEWPGWDEVNRLRYRLQLDPETLDKLVAHTYTHPDTHQFMRDAGQTILDPQSMVTAMFRGLQTQDETVANLFQHGFEPENAARLIETAHRPLDFGQIRTLYWRGKLSEAQVAERLKALGVKDADLEHYTTLWRPSDPFTGEVPSFQDVIQMAVRDVFDPVAVARYGLDAGYPDEVSQFADILGYGDYWAKKYWAAHWQMPGFATARRMLFMSDSFDTTDMRRLLRYADYPPGLVEPMMDATYNPLSRVDIRRMYDLGVMGTAELRSAYQRIGYNDRDADYMVEFTIAYTQEEKVATAKTQILRALRDWLITEQETLDYLLRIGMDSRKASETVGEALIQRALDAEIEEVQTLRVRYNKGLDDVSVVANKLGALNYSNERIQAILRSFELGRQRSERTPSRANLDTFLRKGIIDSARYMVEMAKMGYSGEHAAWFLASAQG